MHILWLARRCGACGVTRTRGALISGLPLPDAEPQGSQLYVVAHLELNRWFSLRRGLPD